jgi:hypothetical protein
MLAELYYFFDRKFYLEFSMFKFRLFMIKVVSSKRVTSLQFDNWGNDLLVSYQSDNIYLLDWRVNFT